MTNRKLNCILLVDDDNDDNVYHQIIIREMDIVNHIEIAVNGLEALALLKDESRVQPELIFLDINMPKMNGWEFLEEYKKIAAEKKVQIVIMILSTSANPDDIKRSKEIAEVIGFETKPLSEETMKQVLKDHFGFNHS